VAADLVNHTYDGEGRRVQQTVSSTITKYLLDIQPGLSVVLSETTGSDVIRNVFSPHGIHAQQDSSNKWQWIATDGLGNVREVVDNSVGVLESRNYAPYGETFGGTITDDLDYEAPNFGFTGELVDGSGLLDLRARRYNAAMGVFTSLDPFEGVSDRAMSLNGYLWVEGNVPNAIDPSGMIYELPSMWDQCGSGNNITSDTPPYIMVSVDDPDPCRRHKNGIAAAIAELAQRATEQIQNFCKLWEISQGRIVQQPGGCEAAGTWGGHQRAMRDVKRDLRKDLKRFNQSGRDGCPDDDGTVNQTANAWLAYPTDELLPKDEAERQGKPQELPPTLAYTPICLGITVFGICIPVVIFPL